FPGEATAAASLAARLAAQWGFTDRNDGSASKREPSHSAQRDWRDDFERTYKRYSWEFRRCGKAKCWCSRAAQGHGPYRYAKKRVNGVPHSIYGGKQSVHR